MLYYIMSITSPIDLELVPLLPFFSPQAIGYPKASETYLSSIFLLIYRVSLQRGTLPFIHSSTLSCLFGSINDIIILFRP